MSAQELFAAAFSVSRDPRSDAYKAGVLAVLRLHVEGVRVRQPYRMGTAEADAFSSGCGEGHLIFRKWKELRNE